MGFWSSVGSALGAVGSFLGGSKGGGGGVSYSSSSNSQTNYDPDKVRVAEIEAESKRDMAVHEMERLRTEMDLVEFHARMEAAVLEAKVRGHLLLQEKLLDMTKALTSIAQERIILLEQGHLEVVAQIDQHYQALGQEINRDNDAYTQEKIPHLLGILAQYSEGSTSHQLYSKMVEQDMARHIDFQTQQFKSVQERRTMMTASAITCREGLEQHINTLVETRMQHFQLALDNSDSPVPLKNLPLAKGDGSRKGQARLTAN
jgi:hypothetical protein